MESQIIPLDRLEPPKNYPDLNRFPFNFLSFPLNLFRFWKIMIFSDGSMTRNLENLTQSEVFIEANSNFFFFFNIFIVIISGFVRF